MTAQPHSAFRDVSHGTLKQSAIRGGAAKLAGQLGNNLVRLLTLVVLARLLEPSDFGLVAMATVIVGFLDVFGTGGLLAATIQRGQVSDAQVSTLFWINLALGTLICAVCLVAAPFISAFYGNPAAGTLTAALAPVFVLNALSTQHMALLQRRLRYVAIATIEVSSQILSSILSIGLAIAGFGYWALALGLLALPLFTVIGSWMAVRWMPSRPALTHGVREMLLFGGTLTLNNAIVYIGYNLEKVLLARNFGSEVLGLYGRAYQLIQLPTQIINMALGTVTFATLSRLQGDPERFKRYFIKVYAFVVSITIPATLLCAVLADEIVLIVLGPQWTGAAEIFRLLAPTILALGIINPMAWLLQSAGRQQRSLMIAVVLAPLVCIAYLVGIPFGPTGVAFSYSTVMLLWIVPHILWCTYDTPVRFADVVNAMARPLIAGAVAALAAMATLKLISGIDSAIVHILIVGTVMAAVYTFALAIVLGQKDFYVDLFRTFRGAT
jgi:O-antigen/teichoic acid export membrane protein